MKSKLAKAPADIYKILDNVVKTADLALEVRHSPSAKILLQMAGPAMRGFILDGGKGRSSEMLSGSKTYFDWEYRRDQPEFTKLYVAAQKGQWDPNVVLPWDTVVDPQHPAIDLFPEQVIPMRGLPTWNKMSKREQRHQGHSLLSYIMSQFLHGEQGALYAACQVTQSVRWMDGKLFGGTQVVDEARHVEVFHRYITEKLEKLYQVNDNMYVIIDALMTDSRWDMKFLGMQIMIEGLALGSFGSIRTLTQEPLLKELLKYVILDEGRHVHYGVLALRKLYNHDLPASEVRDREDWAYEVSVLMRNRFLAHEIYDEYYAHSMSRMAWNRLVLSSDYMRIFREKVFRRIVPNLKRINLLSDRIRPHYEKMGLLEFERGKSASELTTEELLEDIG